ncbi:hypothetical protein VKT23_007544 [Stygiomarasmius scandens]|uniref:Kinase-like protein n=1 Tax=Marasmiellus scandens TaxID=2682957 RepID=A0ABR1JPG9_9AGAR
MEALVESSQPVRSPENSRKRRREDELPYERRPPGLRSELYERGSLVDEDDSNPSFSAHSRLSQYLDTVKARLGRPVYEELMAILLDWWKGRLGDIGFIQQTFQLMSASDLFEDSEVLFEAKRDTTVTLYHPPSEPVSSAILYYQKSHAEIVALSPEAKSIVCKPMNTRELRQMINAGIVNFSDDLPSIMAPCVMQLLQFELDNQGLDSLYRKKCSKCLRSFAKKFHFLPPSLYLKNIVREGSCAIKNGGYADVWKGMMADGQSVCIKVLRMYDNDTRNKVLADFCREALEWQQLDHPNVLPFLGVDINSFRPSFCLISPWMFNGDVMSFLKSHPDHDRILCLQQIAKGINYLHSLNPPIVHGDIKGVNILVDDDHQCCLADFGLASAVESQTIGSASGGIRCTLRWSSPEVIRPDSNPDKKDARPRDIYAFACTTVEILSGEPPFAHHKNEAAVMFDIISGIRPSRPQSAWCLDFIWDLVERCWAQDIFSRPHSLEVCHALLLETSTPTESQLGQPSQSISSGDTEDEQVQMTSLQQSPINVDSFFDPFAFWREDQNSYNTRHLQIVIPLGVPHGDTPPPAPINPCNSSTVELSTTESWLSQPSQSISSGDTEDEQEQMTSLQCQWSPIDSCIDDPSAFQWEGQNSGNTPPPAPIESYNPFTVEFPPMRNIISTDAQRRASHSRRKHPGILYLCDICDQDFTSRQNLRNHINAHNGIKPYACSICEEAFGTSQSLKRHSRKHINM